MKGIKIKFSYGDYAATQAGVTSFMDRVQHAIEDLDVGWTIDTENVTGSSTPWSHSRDGYGTAFVWLKHTTGARICLALNLMQSDIMMEENEINYVGNSNHYSGGMMVSYIPPLPEGVTVDWPMPFDTGAGASLRPSGRWSSPFSGPACTNGGSLNSVFYKCMQTSGSTGSYSFVFHDDTETFTIWSHGSWMTNGKGHLTTYGKIFSVVDNPVEDNDTLSLFGVLHYNGDEDNEADDANPANWSFVSTKTAGYWTSPNMTCPYHNPYIMPGNSNYKVIAMFDGGVSNYSSMHNVSNSGRERFWTLHIGANISDQINYGVVPGDSYKGYLRNDLIMYCTNGNYALGTTFNSGKIRYLGPNVVTSWDPTLDFEPFDNN